MTPDILKYVPLIIKSKEKQIIEKTKANLNKKTDPINSKTNNVENRWSGTVVIYGYPFRGFKSKRK